MTDRGGWVIGLSFLVALVLQVLPMPQGVPEAVGFLRPEWVALVLIYWVIALPHRIGLVTAWVLGLIVDVLMGSLLGQHAVTLVVVAYIAVSLYQRLRMFSIWQQSAIVFATVGVHQLMNFWIESLTGQREWNLWYLMTAVVSALFWPWVFLLLRALRRRYGVG